MFNEFLDWCQRFFAYVVFAMIGGTLGSLIRSRNSGEELRLFYIFLEAIASGFVGVIVLLMCRAAHLSPEWTGIATGMSGWLGAGATIQIIEKIVYSKLGLLKKQIPKIPEDE